MHRFASLPIVAAGLALAFIGFDAHAQTAINQASALAGGLSPGDAPGFPVTISQPGSYRLTSNLTPPAGAGAIVVTAPNVSIDLNGFTIQGPATCTGTGAALSCKGWLNGDFGIASTGVNTSIRNGTITGMAYAVNLFGTQGGGGVEGVTFIGNVQALQTSGNVRVRRNQFYRNENAVYEFFDAAVPPAMSMEGNVAWDNLYTATLRGAGGLVAGNVISASSNTGLDVTTTFAIAGNVLTGGAKNFLNGPKIQTNSCNGAAC